MLFSKKYIFFLLRKNALAYYNASAVVVLGFNPGANPTIAALRYNNSAVVVHT
jgi:hypothetical protein